MPVSQRRVAAIALAGGLALAGCASAPPAAEPVAQGDLAGLVQQLTRTIGHELDAQRIAGLSIALVDDQRLVWAQGFGWADVAARRPAQADTLYRVGSVSKLFTDTAAMQLVAQGRLQLDAPIQQLLPDWRIRSRWGEVAITPRQLMTHHSGLPRDMLGGMWGTQVGDFRTMLAGLADPASPEEAAAPPGLAFGYSNIGLDLLGLAIERASGRRFEQQLRQTLLEPLGMHEAVFSAGPVDSPRMAQGHLKSAPQVEPGLRDLPAGGLTASVTDLARFVSMQFAGGRNAAGEPLLPAALVAEMLRVQNAQVPLDSGFGVGLGWMLATFGRDTVQGGGPVAHHAGATFYHRAQLMMLPAQRLGVIVAANDGAAGPVVDRVAARALALLLEAKTGQRQPARVPGVTLPARAPWSEAQRQACEGDYVTPAGLATLRRDGPRLRAELDGRTLELIEGEDGWAGLRYRLLGVLPLTLELLDGVGLQCRRVAGRQVLVARLDGQELRLGDRLPAPDGPLPAEVSALAGDWAPVLAPGEVATVERVRIEVDRGRLWVRPTLSATFGGDSAGRLPLQLLSPTQARLPGTLADTGPVITLRPPERAGEAPGFAYSGWVFRRIGP
ncbi:MAG: beta-lactamase family protein [Burkholderiaceae bacterium]|nr:beta-lactamase family protein [Burkholderiaceae bacterium]